MFKTVLFKIGVAEYFFGGGCCYGNIFFFYENRSSRYSLFASGRKMPEGKSESFVISPSPGATAVACSYLYFQSSFSLYKYTHIHSHTLALTDRHMQSFKGS